MSLHLYLGEEEKKRIDRFLIILEEYRNYLGKCENGFHNFKPRYSETFGGTQTSPSVAKTYIGECCIKCGKFIGNNQTN